MKKKNREERGRRVAEARQLAGLSQTEVAERMGCSRQLIGSIENGGNMSVDQLETMCAMFGCSAESIVFGSVPEQAHLGDDIAVEFKKLRPGLREQLWMLYQVFIRRGAQDPARAPASGI